MTDALPPDSPFGDSLIFPAHTVLCSAGQDIRTITLIDEGVVTTTIAGPAGDVFVGVFARGFLLAGASALTGRRHLASVTTLGELKVRTVSVPAFHEARRRDVAFSNWVERSLAMEMACGLRQLAGATAHLAEDRLVAHFSELFRAAGELRPDGSMRLGVVVSVDHLANAIRTSREATSRLLGDLARRGILVRDGRSWFSAPAGSPIATGHDFVNAL